MLARWNRAVSVYGDRRLAVILFFGFSSGLPLALTGATLSAWLHDDGIDKAAIGAFTLVGSAYSFKFLWAPILDRVDLPVLTRLLGRRRSWLLVMQVGLFASVWTLSTLEPSVSAWAVARWAVVVAFCSASQDIVIDAYRVERLDKDQQGAGAGVYTLGYRLAMIASGAGGLILATWWGWQAAYMAMAIAVAAGMITTLVCAEPKVPAGTVAHTGWLHWIKVAVLDPFIEFTKNPGWAAILIFVVTFKLADQVQGAMSTPFYLELGFTKPEIAAVSKTFGVIATILGGIMGGALVARYGIVPTLFGCGAGHMLSNLMSVVQALAGHSVPTLYATIGLENLSNGMSSVAFVAYLSGLCSIAFTATQYALLSSLAAFGRTVLSSPSGLLAKALGWPRFFLVTTFIALPSLALLWWMTRRFPPRPAPATAEATEPA